MTENRDVLIRWCDCLYTLSRESMYSLTFPAYCTSSIAIES